MKPENAREWGGEVFVENPPNHRRENLPKNKRALSGQATGRYRWRSDRIGRGKNWKMSTLSPFVKVAAGAGALVLGYLGYRYDASNMYFSSHNCRSLILYYTVYWPQMLSLFFVFGSRKLLVF
jgi:hypothetical protein